MTLDPRRAPDFQFMLLSTLLRKENNNLDIFRVIAAAMVIYGHAYALLPTAGQQDFLGRLLAIDYSGSIAVKVFFFLSGLVVTSSLVEKKDFFKFVISRFFRIWPAFGAVLAAMAFVIGPIFSTHSPGNYFSNATVYEYFLHGLIMDVRYELPGVFQGNAISAANGSLWSIPFEVFAYIALIAVFLLGLLKFRLLSVGVFLLILVDSITGHKLLLTWLPQNHEITTLAPCFAAGSVFALFKDKIKIHLKGVAGAWALYFLFRESTYSYYFLYLAVFYAILFFSSQKALVRPKPSIDVSYGMYLWGWPVQQIMAQYFPEWGIGFNQIASIAISALLGYASWLFIEKRAIKIGSDVGKWVSSKIAPRGLDSAKRPDGSA
ncbi:acyltransferase family protein [Castellaniella hirudinis]|uniref:acyltransferase family protein n=1 Tax=Castellaniella hirudinis TaxID=1144617 RepID=UPI0039C36841